MIIGMIANRVPQLIQGLQPTDIWLLQYTTDTKVMQDATPLLDQLTCLDRIFLSRLIKIPFLVVPLGKPSTRLVSAHFQIERNSNLSFWFIFAGCHSAVRRGSNQASCQAASQELSSGDMVTQPRLHGRVLHGRSVDYFLSSLRTQETWVTS